MYWLILLRPNSPSRLSAWSEGTTPVISCMMIDALMYGFMPTATTEKLERPPPEKRLSRPIRALPSMNSFSVSRLMPGTGTAASRRKTISSAST